MAGAMWGPRRLLVLAVLVLCLAVALGRSSGLRRSLDASIASLYGAGGSELRTRTNAFPAVPPLTAAEIFAMERLRRFRYRAPGRLISMGDIHGDALGLRLMLAELGLIDSETRTKWTGGNATLVQTGDLVDRGEDSASAIRLLARLQQQAAEVGGAVFTLMGNHELMQLVHDFRFVSHNENQGYGGSTQARAMAFSRAGEFGKWLRSLPVAVVVEPSDGASAKLFCHAGLDSMFLRPSASSAEDALALLDADFDVLIRRADENHEVAYIEPMLGEHGPLWSRFFSMKKNETLVCSHLHKTLSAVEATHMVVGHTVVDGPVARCAGKLIMGDVGFSPYYNPPQGNRLALEFMPGGEVRIWRPSSIALE